MLHKTAVMIITDRDRSTAVRGKSIYSIWRKYQHRNSAIVDHTGTLCH
jgi:(p)ppGpp synthase/HD superfamily hydrolase